MKSLNNHNMEEYNINSRREENVYSGDFVNIVRDVSTGIYSILFDYPNSVLINSVLKTRILQGGTTTEDYKVVKFRAKSVKSLKQFQCDMMRKTGAVNLPVNVVAQITASLARQLMYLISSESHTFLGYNQDAIIVINDQKFAFLGSEFLLDICDDNLCQITCPFQKTDFFYSSEVMAIKSIPSKVHYKTSYFSLACLIISLLKREISDDFPTLESLNNHCIMGTKIYWLLSRCLVNDPNKRSILFI